MTGWLDRVRDAGVLLIAGPTASGKSARALEAAEAIAAGGRTPVVVNADSMQVYRELRLLTARPSDADQARAVHRLYGTVPAGERHSTGRWLNDVAALLAELRSQGAVPILVGGTGLYFRALLEGIADVPPIPPEVRERWAEEHAFRGTEGLHAVLGERDAVTAQGIRPSDPQRILRALEVLDATGRSLRQWQAESSPPLIDRDEAMRVVLDPDRAVLGERIARRFDAMIEAGALDEVRALLELGLPPDLPASKAIGVRELAAVLRGETSLADASAAAKLQTRRYAKRQLTWFRNQMRDWERLPA
jgi:tRNA dimethylallyltransferase